MGECLQRAVLKIAPSAHLWADIKWNNLLVSSGRGGRIVRAQSSHAEGRKFESQTSRSNQVRLVVVLHPSKVLGHIMQVPICDSMQF